MFAQKNTNFISLGSFFITYEDIKERWISSTNVPFDKEQINNLDEELMVDSNLFSKFPISAEILEYKTPFIDIGIPSSLRQAQFYIPKIIKN